MSSQTLIGELVRLTAIDAESFSELDAKWSGDSEFMRLLDSNPVVPWTSKRSRDEIEKIEIRNTDYLFAICTLGTDQIIGYVELEGIQWSHGEAWYGIGIGERDYQGKGYGSDATRVILRFAFDELNLHRVTLNVFEYNTRAIRSYEKLGFNYEGRTREYLNRDGKRWDMLFFGILREEWEGKSS